MARSKMATRVAAATAQRRRASRTLLLLAAAVAAVLAAGWVGWWLNGRSGPARPVKVLDTFTGRVTIINHPGVGGCVQPDRGGRPVCTVFFMPFQGSLNTGDRVRAAHELVSTGGGDGYDLLLVYPVQPPG
jgi:hypothetical protein